jgi:hypothetical protein
VDRVERGVSEYGKSILGMINRVGGIVYEI